MDSNVGLAIIINLSLALLVLAVASSYSLRKLVKERDGLKASLRKAKKNLREALSPIVDPKIPLSGPSPVFESLIDELQGELLERERIIQELNEVQRDSESSGDSVSEDQIDEIQSKARAQIEILLNSNVRSANLIKKLKEDLSKGQERINQLLANEKHAREDTARDLESGFSDQRIDGNISRLQIKNNNLQDELDQLNERHQKQFSYNKKLVGTLSDLKADADLAGRSLKDAKMKLRMSQNIESRLKTRIESLEEDLAAQSDSQAMQDLEKEIEDLREELDRTLREKKFIENHLLNLDESMDQIQDVEEQLLRANLEIETLEKFVVLFDEELDEKKSVEGNVEKESKEISESSVMLTSEAELNQLLTQGSTSPHQERDDVMGVGTLEDTRSLAGGAAARSGEASSPYQIFPFVHDFFVKFLNTSVSEATLSASQKDLDTWVNVNVGEDRVLAVGMNDGMALFMAEKLFDTGSAPTDLEKKDAVGELANVVAGMLINDIFEGCDVGIPEHVSREDNEQLLSFATMDCETGARRGSFSIYLTILTTG